MLTGFWLGLAVIFGTIHFTNEKYGFIKSRIARTWVFLAAFGSLFLCGWHLGDLFRHK